MHQELSLYPLTKFPVDSIDANDIPFMQLVCRKLGLALTSKEYRKFCNKHLCNAKLHYWVFGLFNRVIAAFVKVLSDEPSISAAHTINGTSQLANINMSHFRMSNNVLTRGLELLESIVSEAETAEETVLYKASPFSDESRLKLQRKLESSKKRSLFETPNDDKKKKAKQSPLGGTPAKNKGPICVNKAGTIIPLSTITWPPGVTPLCPAILRDKSKGCPKDNCQDSHDGPDEWSDPTWVVLKEMVVAHSYLTWNKAMVTPEMLGMEYSKSDPTKVP